MNKDYDIDDAARELTSTGRRAVGLALLAFVGFMLLILPLEGQQYIWAAVLSFPLWGLGLALLLGLLKAGLFSSRSLYLSAIALLVCAFLPGHDGPSSRMGALALAAMSFAAARSRRARERGGWV